MGCGTSCVKYLLFILNLLFVLAGIALIAIGVLLKINIDDYTAAVENMDKHFSLAPTLVIVVGSIIFVISFFGCCGAIRESTCMLTTYAIILLTIFIIQVALGVFAFLQFKDSDEGIRSEIGKELRATFEQYNKNDVAREAVDSLQYGVQCCGLENANYWVNSTLPSSCCANKPDVCHKSMAFPEGCVPKLFQYITKSVNIIGIVVIVIAIIELLGAIVALCLSSSIRNYERRGHYA